MKYVLLLLTLFVSGMVLIAEMDYHNIKTASENRLQSTITAQADSIRVLNDSLAYYEPHKAREALLRYDLRHCDDMLDYNIRKMQRVRPQ